MEVGGQLYAPAALAPGKEPITRWIGGSVDLSLSESGEENRINFLPCLCGELNLGCLVCSLVTFLPELNRFQQY